MEYNEHMLIGSILNDMSDGILVIGFDGRIRLHNHAAEQMLGLPGSALKNRTIADIMTQTEDIDQLFECVLTAVHTKEKSVKTVPCFCNNHTTYLRITSDLLRIGSEQIGLLLQITDITDTTKLFITKKRLANQIMDLMNSFVEVMVTAIEEKSPYNANHTKSMAQYAANYLAWLSDQGRLTEYTSENTEPFLMSVWLHDIGKLLIPHDVMNKPTRLGSAEETVRHRIETAKLMLKIRSMQDPESAAEAAEKTAQLDEAEARIFSANTAGFLDDDTREQLRQLAEIPCTAADGSVHPLLTEHELTCITIPRGTLTAEERQIIESHVTYTAKLLSKVEFRGDYKPVPKWAARHHEMLDGSGYPDHLTAEHIPWETRLLTITDIYDALTAEDRPYKPPMEPEKAFAILRNMAEKGKLDSDILRSFYESGAWSKPANQT